MSDVVGKLQFLIDVNSKDGVAEIKKFSQATEEGAKQTEGSSSLMSKALKGVNLTTVGLATAAITAFTKIVKKCVEMQKAYENTRAVIAKATGASGKDLKDMTQSAVALAGYTNKSMEEVGQALGDVNTRFHVTGQELRTLTKDFLDFANVTGQDVSTAIRSVSQIMNKWGLKDSTELMDKLTVASQAGGIAITQLESEVNQYASTLKYMGFNLTESIALLTQLESQGISSSEVIMGMKKVVGDGAKEGLTAQQAWEKYTEEIKNMASETGAVERATELFGERLAIDLVDAIRSGRLEFETFKKVLEDSEGAMQKTAKASETTKQGLKRLFSVFKEDTVRTKEFGETFNRLPITKWVSAFASLEEQTRKLFAPKMITQYFQAMTQGKITTEDMVQSLARLFDSTEEFNQAIAQGTELSGEQVEAIREIISERENLRAEINAEINAYKEEQRIAEESAKAEEEAIKAVAKAQVQADQERGKSTTLYYQNLENRDRMANDNRIKAENEYQKALRATQNAVNGLAGSWNYVYGVMSDIYDRKIALEEDYLNKLLENRQRDIDRQQQETDIIIGNYKNQLQAGLITQQQYDQAVMKSNEKQAEYVAERTKKDEQTEREYRKKLNELQYKQFLANRANAVAQALINSAGAILKAYEQLGPVGGSIAAVAIGTLTGIQIAAINEQQFVPSYRVGSDYITADMRADVHRGEAILKPADAQRYRDLGGIYGLERALSVKDTDIASRQALNLNNNLNAVIEVDGVQLGIAVLKNMNEAMQLI